MVASPKDRYVIALRPPALRFRLSSSSSDSHSGGGLRYCLRGRPGRVLRAMGSTRPSGSRSMPSRYDVARTGLLQSRAGRPLQPKRRESVRRDLGQVHPPTLRLTRNEDSLITRTGTSSRACPGMISTCESVARPRVTLRSTSSNDGIITGSPASSLPRFPGLL